MKMDGHYLKRFHHRVGWLGITILMLPILAWVWLAAREPVISVFNGCVPHLILSGKLFSERFNTISAGFTMDQPTIGKWLFWFTVMTVSSLPYAAAVRWLSNRAKGSAYLAYVVCVVILGIFLLCILSWPLSWLIQYVASMGFTPRRICGLIYSVAGGLLVIGFLSFAFRKPNAVTESTARIISGGWCAVATFTAVIGLAIVMVNWQSWADKYYCLKRIDHQQVAKACSDLFRNKQFSNKVDRITYIPGRNWQALPPELRGLDLQSVIVWRDGVALWKTREAILVFKQSKTNAAVFELVFNGKRLLCQINMETTTADQPSEGTR